MQKHILPYFLILIFCILSQAQINEEKPSTQSFHPAPLLNDKQKQEVRDIMREVLEKWSDRYGFLRLTPCGSQDEPIDNENPVLFTSEYFYLLWRLGMLEGEVKASYMPKVIGMIGALRLEPGLFNRRPGQEPESFDRHFSVDEQVGLVTLDMVFDWNLGFARELAEYGRANDYCYQNRDWSGPGKHDRQAQGQFSSALELYFSGRRLPQFIEYVRLAAKESPSLLGQKFFRQALRLTMSEPREETSGKILAYLRSEVFRGHDAESDQVIDEFLHKMRIIYGDNALHEIMKIYFTHESHPCRRLASLLLVGRTLPPILTETAIDPFTGVRQSQVTVSVEMDLGNLAQVANQNLGEELFRCSGVRIASIEKYVDITYQLLVSRNGDIHITAQDDNIVITVPLRFEARADWAIKKIIKHHESADGALTIQMSCKIGVSDDWQATTQINTSFQWNEKPSVKIGPVNIRISSVSGHAIQQQLNKLSARLDREIQKKIHLRELAEKHLLRIVQPILLTKKPTTWLWCHPDSLKVSPLRLANDKVSISITLLSRMRLHVGDKPRTLPLADSSKLPTGGTAPNGEDTENFYLHVPVTLEYREIERQALTAMTRKPLTWKTMEATIRDVRVYGTEDCLVVAIQFTAKGGQILSEHGWMFLAGSLKVNEKNELALEKLEFLHLFSSEGAKWLASAVMPVLQEEICSHLRAFLQREMERAPERLNKLMSHVVLGDVALLEGKINRMSTAGVRLGEKAMEITVEASGSLRLEINPESLRKVFPGKH